MLTTTKKSVFITGGSSGLGLELAKLFHENGHRVGISSRNPDTAREKLHADIIFYKADVSVKEEIHQAIEHFAIQGLDIVIANAGIAYANKSKVPDFKYSEQMIKTNILGVLYTFEKAVEIFIKNGQGHLVATSSVAGYNGLPGVSFYSASKAAVMNICESFALDFKSIGIDTTCLIPGFIDTPLTRVNPHPMPFMLTASEAASKAYKAIIKKKVFYAFPWQMAFVTRFLSLLPRSVYRFIMSIKIFNFSKKEEV